MKSVENSFIFDPELRLYSAGQQVTVMFDSRCAVDQNRATLLASIPKGLEGLTVAVSGFDQAEDEGARRVISGAISLKHKGDAGQEAEKIIANCSLVFNATGKPDKKGNFQHVEPAYVHYVIKQAVSEALSGAVVDYFEAAHRPAGEKLPAASQGVQVASAGPVSARSLSRREERQVAQESAARSQRREKRNTRLAWAVPPLLVVLFFGGTHLLANKQPGIENAVAQQMANDPESIKQQVELVNQTLQSMGLDPGKGGDLGCLAPQ